MEIIKDFYYGRIMPFEKNYNNARYTEVERMFYDTEEKLTEMLSGKELKVFNTLIDVGHEVSAISDFENFKLGFRLGLQLMCDSMGEEL